MREKFLYSIICLLFISIPAFADKYVPNFKEMKTIRCDVEETIFTKENTPVSHNKYFRIFNLDDTNKKIYLQKALVDKILYYEADRIEFNSQHLTDDFIMLSKITIDRKDGKYSSESTLTYDNEMFGIRHAKASGSCHLIN